MCRDRMVCVGNKEAVRRVGEDNDDVAENRGD